MRRYALILAVGSIAWALWAASVEAQYVPRTSGRPPVSNNTSTNPILRRLQAFRDSIMGEDDPVPQGGAANRQRGVPSQGTRGGGTHPPGLPQASRATGGIPPGTMSSQRRANNGPRNQYTASPSRSGAIPGDVHQVSGAASSRRRPTPTLVAEPGESAQDSGADYPRRVRVADRTGATSGRTSPQPTPAEPEPTLATDEVDSIIPAADEPEEVSGDELAHVVTGPAADFSTPSSNTNHGAEISSPRTEPAAPARPSVAPAPSVLMSRRSPMLSVEVAGPQTVTIGKTSLYTVVLRNAGEIEAKGVTVTVMIPSWADLVESRPTAGLVPEGRRPASEGRMEEYVPLTWTLEQVAARGEEKLQMRLIPRKSIPFDLGVQYAIRPLRSQAMVEVQEPKLEMLVAGPAEIHFGEKKLYRLTLTNPGTGDAENVVLHVFVGDSQDQAATDSIPILHAGESKVLEMELEAHEAGALMIRALATADGGLEASAAENVLVRRAGIMVAAEGPERRFASTGTTYRIKVHNPGNATADNIRLAVSLPAGAEFISASQGGRHQPKTNQVGWIVPNLAAGQDQTLEVRCVLNRPGTNLLRFGAVAEGSLSHSGSLTTEVEAIADLRLDIRDPLGPVAVGEDAIYEIRIRNRGTKAAEDIHVVAYFSNGIEPTGVDGGRGAVAPGQVSFDAIPLLDAGEELLLRVRARAEQPGVLGFQAQVTCEPLDLRLSATETTRFYDPVGKALNDVAPPDRSEPTAKNQRVPEEARSVDEGQPGALLETESDLMPLEDQLRELEEADRE